VSGRYQKDRGSVRDYLEFAGRTPRIEPVMDPLNSLLTPMRKPKPENKGYRTCAECIEYKTCLKLDFLKPHHATLLSDLDFIKKNGFDQYVEQIIAKSKVKPIIIG
jgi:hypothetical protein